MSVNQNEEGIIKLPTAEFSKFRKVIEDANNEIIESAFAKTQEIWGKLTPKEKKSGDVGKIIEDHAYVKVTEKGFGGVPIVSYEEPNDVSDLEYAFSVAKTRGTDGALKRPVRSDFVFSNNRTNVFDLKNAAIIFDRDKSLVMWSVPDNNHAVDEAHRESLAKIFFDALEKVRWSRGTGGMITGNDEYNRDHDDYDDDEDDDDNNYDYDDSYGESSRYEVRGYGPLGASVNSYVTNPYIDSSGKRVDPMTESNKSVRLVKKGFHSFGSSGSTCSEYLPRAQRRCTRPAYHVGAHR